MARPPHKKNAIERSALELFVEKGIDGTSIRDIAHRAGVTEGALYRHHKSKDDLVRHLFFTHYAGFADMMRDVQAKNTAFVDSITALVSAFFEFYDRDPYVFQFVILARHKLLDEVRKDERNPVEVLNQIVGDAVANGESSSRNPVLAVQLILGMVSQTAVACRYDRIPAPLLRHAKEVTRQCLLVAEAVKA